MADSLLTGDQPTPLTIRLISDPPPPPPPPADDTTPKKPVDNFYPAWSKFIAAQTKRAKKTNRTAREIVEVKQEVADTPGDGLQVQENTAKSWAEATAECKAKVAAIVEECTRLNQKYRDILFDLSDLNSLMTLDGRFPDCIDDPTSLPSCKRVGDIFDKPEFFINGADADDVHQGNDGDCWFLAALMAICAKKELIERLCVARDEKIGVYGFVFFKDGEWVHEVIDDKLFVRVDDDDNLDIVRDWNKYGQTGQSLRYDDDKLKAALGKGGEALFFSHCKSNETWLPLIEKAYAKAHGDYNAIEGGFASEGIEDLTGGVGASLDPNDIMDKERFWKEELSQVNTRYLFGGGSRRVWNKGIVGGHAYAVLRAWESEDGKLKLLKIRNPWGEFESTGDWADGARQWTPEMMIKLDYRFGGDDGVFWMSYEDFLKRFRVINRVRIFDDSWTVAQQWTSVNVPWAVDYLDTKFQFTTTEKGTAIIVLGQPDSRYYNGLAGRYIMALHFRVYKAGSDQSTDRWIVRSMLNSGSWSGCTRSVNAEIDDLEPGTYDVIFKVTAMRTDSAPTAAAVIVDTAVARKEKLLAVGRRFDYAMSKGNLRALEESNRQSATDEQRELVRERWKKGRKLNQLERLRTRARKRRVDDALRVQRHAIFDRAKAKKEAEAKEKAEKAKATASTDDAKEKAGDESEVKATSDENKEDALTAATEGETKESTAEEGAATLESGVSKLDIKDDTAETPADSSVETAKTEPSADDATETTKTDSPPADTPDTEESKADGPSDEPAEADAADDQAATESDAGYESPPEEPDDLEDNDFDWDSEIDGELFSSDDDDEAEDIFEDDPWNAMCVLGLRVYSQDKNVSVKVLKAENDS